SLTRRPPRSTLFPYTTLSDLRDHGEADLHLLAHPHADDRVGGEEDVDARAELDHADALAAHDLVAFFLVEDDAPRQQPGDLLEGDRKSTRLNSSHVEISYAVF